MVTAGVYMIGRNAVLFSHAPETMMIVAVIGALTALMAGTIGLVQNDIKRVLAYSTVSQLGYMFLAMGVGAFGAGIFHLYTHAFFKALLFLGSGAVIHALHGEQDIRNMGGLKKELPITYWTFLIGALAIAGVPAAGRLLQQGRDPLRDVRRGPHDLWVIGALTSLLTATYMFRLVFLTFYGERATMPAQGMRHAHAAPPAHLARRTSHGITAARHHTRTHGPTRTFMTRRRRWRFALIVLAIGSVRPGYIGIPHALGGHNQLAPGWSRRSRAAAGGATAEAAGEGEAGAEGAEAEGTTGARADADGRVERHRRRRHRHRLLHLGEAAELPRRWPRPSRPIYGCC